MRRRVHGYRSATVIGAILCAALISATSCRTSRSSSPAGAAQGAGELTAVDGLGNVDRILDSEKRPFVLFYHSPRCGYCGLMMRTIERDIADFGPKAVIYTVDLDSSPGVREDKGIGPVPVVLFYRNGREVNRWRAFRPGFMLRSSFRSFFED